VTVSVTTTLASIFNADSEGRCFLGVDFGPFTAVPVNSFSRKNGESDRSGAPIFSRFSATRRLSTSAEKCCMVRMTGSSSSFPCGRGLEVFLYFSGFGDASMSGASRDLV
jgi:hypothetical protein